MIHDLINADNLELIIALIAIVFLLLLCFLFSQLHSMKKEKYESLAERTTQKRNNYFDSHPYSGKEKYFNNEGFNKRDRHDEINATKGTPQQAAPEITDNPVEDCDMVQNQQDNVIVWDNLESTPDDSNSAEKLESDKHEEYKDNKYKYMQSAVEGRFLKLLTSEEKCFFRTWEEHGERKYEFYGNVKKALANINAIFDDVCEIEGKQNGATNIDNIAPGILDGNLKITTKARIKLS